MKRIIVWGASGHAKVVADIIRLRADFEIVGFLDSVNPERRLTEFCGAHIIGGEEQLDSLRQQGVDHLIFGFGNCEGRLLLAPRATSKGFQLARAIHPSAVIASDVILDPGVVVAAGAVINTGSHIGENAIINTSASVDHDCMIGAAAHVCPGAHLAGQVTVGEATWIGIGSTIMDHLSIGSHSLVGAGSVVIRSIPDRVVAYGNPARVMREA
jgi:sugar O-acyltransferase (sialic acid O-acetyltransferase NeuD family)